ncbi:hypothetical protein Ahy_A03g012198 [Arachis hypogaea]|uniref:Uncharacterized protein n=1 Tax=Arachis hypogaea TaxID=3818 RepID=A0A445DSR0_ARAHY|nr:hypothetical protein Ahy_A03g012198 [Arachis hypogaea]
MEMINQSGIDPSESAASMNKRDENEPLLVNVKEMEMINQSGIDPSESAASMNKRDENEPLLVNVKEMEMINQSGIDPSESAASMNKRDENEPLLVNVKEMEMINQSGIDPSESAASMNKRDENEPLLVNVKGGRTSIRHKYLPQDQERAATEGIHSKVLAHSDDAIEKVCGPENGKRVHSFSNATCPSGFGKSTRIFGIAIVEVLAVHCNNMSWI